MWMVLLAACTPDAPEEAPEAACPCDRIVLPSEPVTDEAGLVALLTETRTKAFSSLDGLAIAVAPVDDLAYFRAWPELDTLLLEPRDRDYTIQYDPITLSDPMSPAALAAVLVHELGHIDDYVGMTGEELVEFGLWYATEDPSTSDGLADYERGTDEKALERGCADGLVELKDWIYAHATPEILVLKQRNYYTPEEIAAWTDEHGECLN